MGRNRAPRPGCRRRLDGAGQRAQVPALPAPKRESALSDAGDWTEARANSEGLFAYYRYAEASMILTCRTPDGTGSGWGGITGCKDIAQIDAAAISETAATKALTSRKARALR